MSFGEHMYGIILSIYIGVESWDIRLFFFSSLVHTAKPSSIPKLLCKFTLPPTVHEILELPCSPVVGGFCLFHFSDSVAT